MISPIPCCLVCLSLPHFSYVRACIVMDNVDEMIKSRSIPAIPVKKVGNGNTKQVDETSSDDSSDDDSSDEIDSSLAAKRHWMIGVQIAVVTGIVAAQLLKFA